MLQHSYPRHQGAVPALLIPDLLTELLRRALPLSFWSKRAQLAGTMELCWFGCSGQSGCAWAALAVQRWEVSAVVITYKLCLF